MFVLLIILTLVQLFNGLKIRNAFSKEPEDIQGIVGSTLILHCSTDPLEESDVTWCKNDFCTLGKTRDLPFYPRYEIIGQAHRGEHHFKIVNLSLEDMGIYQCQIRAGPRRSASMSRKGKLTVLQIPQSLSIDSPIYLTENVFSFVVCRGMNAIPEVKLSWNFDRSIMNCLSKNDYALLSDQSLRTSISNITFFPTRSFHGQIIECQAHSQALQILNQTMITQQIIQTIFKPEVNLTLIGKQIEDQSILFHCQIYSRPNLTQIQWFNGTSLIQGENRNELKIFLQRFMHRNQITCQVTNQIGQTNQSIILNIIYKPIFVDSFGNMMNNYSVQLINERERIQLKCLVHSSPMSMISCLFNGKEILEENCSSIERSSDHLGLYMCIAHHPIFGIFNQTIRLTLKGPPEIIEQQTIYSASLGQTSTLICSISTDIPIQEISWSREDQSKIVSNEKYQMIENRTIHLIEYYLFIFNLISKDEGYYICTTRNSYGSSKSQYQLRINNSKDSFLQHFLLYSSIFLGLLLSFILILFSIIHRYQQKRTDKSSRTDETLSALDKQQQHQEDYQDETNSSIDQDLINHPNTDLFNTPRDQFFYLRENLNRYSTVV